MNFKLWLEVRENGVTFQTGTPVTFEFMRNTEKSPNFGSKYGQDIEPAGRYMLHNTSNTTPEQKEYLNKSGWETGIITFNNPLVVDLSSDRDESGLMQNIYGEKGWKQRLANQYKATGKELTNRIKQDGHDGIVTVSGYDTREIVDLTFGKNDHDNI
tara:strand:- start:239 stop:709 length:471 start_codon:yes stop_codon:yes gene_type:complete